MKEKPPDKLKHLSPLPKRDEPPDSETPVFPASFENSPPDIEKAPPGKWWNPLNLFARVFKPAPTGIGSSGMGSAHSGAVIMQVSNQQEQQSMRLEAQLEAPAEAHPGQDISVNLRFNYHFDGPSAPAIQVGCHLLTDDFEVKDPRRSVEPPRILRQLQVPFQLLTKTPKGQARRPLLTAIISAGGQPCGMVSKGIYVHAADTPEALGAPYKSASAQEQPKTSIVITKDPDVSDLTVTIVPATHDEGEGVFLWKFDSPHDVQMPKESLRMDLGGSVDKFVSGFISQMEATTSEVLALNKLDGSAKRLKRAVPHAEFCSVLAQVWDKFDKTKQTLPSVLFSSQEHRIPWELIPGVELDPGKLPYLGAQVCLGRGIGPCKSNAPRLKVELKADNMVVMAARYYGEPVEVDGKRQTLYPLESAIQEAQSLVDKYQARTFFLNVEEWMRLVNGKLGPPPDTPGIAKIIHLICHGKDDALFLEANERLNSCNFETIKWAKDEGPFLFVNACQAGNASELLGISAGFASSSLWAGFSGFLAPLWSINDKAAKKFADDFYERVLSTKGVAPPSVSEVLATLRNKGGSTSEPSSAYLAYAFYGHPRLRLRRPSGWSLGEYPKNAPLDLSEAVTKADPPLEALSLGQPPAPPGPSFKE